jgi:hypothetical protein
MFNMYAYKIQLVFQFLTQSIKLTKLVKEGVWSEKNMLISSNLMWDGSSKLFSRNKIWEVTHCSNNENYIC